MSRFPAARDRDGVPEADLAGLEATGRAFCEIVQRIKDRYVEGDDSDEVEAPEA